mgnify:CR=1 FL=1
MNKKKLINQINIYRSVLILLVICVFATILSPSFLSVTNLFNVFKQITVAGIVGCGMTFVILTGGIDLSVGSILGLSGVLASGVLASTGNTAVAVAVSLTVGIACGAVNGFFVSVCGIPPFISTLGMMTLLRGVILVYTKGSPIPIKSDAYKFFGKGSIAGIPVPVIILIIVFLLAHYILTQTSYGRSVYAVGGNREAARLSGIRVKTSEFLVYTLNGLMWYGRTDPDSTSWICAVHKRNRYRDGCHCSCYSWGNQLKRWCRIRASDGSRRDDHGYY